MRNTILNILDSTGAATFAGMVYMNITSWLDVQTWNQIALFLTTIGGLAYLGMKIYHQFLITKKERKNQGRKGLF